MLEQRLDIACGKVVNQVGVGVGAGWCGEKGAGGEGGGPKERECKGMWALAIKDGRIAPFRFHIIVSQSLNANAGHATRQLLGLGWQGGFTECITHPSLVIKDQVHVLLCTFWCELLFG